MGIIVNRSEKEQRDIRAALGSDLPLSVVVEERSRFKSHPTTGWRDITDTWRHAGGRGLAPELVAVLWKAEQAVRTEKGPDVITVTARWPGRQGIGTEMETTAEYRVSINDERRVR